MDHRCVPRQVLPSNPRYESYAVWSFAISSKEASRFFCTGDISFEQGAQDNVINGIITQRTTRSLPTHKAVMALRPNSVAALALMGDIQGQTKAEAKPLGPPHCRGPGHTQQPEAPSSSPPNAGCLSRRVWPGPPTQQRQDLFRPYPSQLRGGPRRSV